ncbi:MAG TPA: hypothetical protein DIT89_14905, partial [Planctomycetaceae bacterium]|nr:hypothetical protein [Planctomycetaceae bacterium]
AVAELVIAGPLGASESGQSDSRRRILTAMPSSEQEVVACAEQIFLGLLRQAYRRPISAADLQMPMQLFQLGWQDEQDFEAGIERGLAGILSSPQFLFRVERGNGNDTADAAQVTGVELASRLSFFLWSSLPDEELLRVAESGRLLQPEE